MSGGGARGKKTSTPPEGIHTCTIGMDSFHCMTSNPRVHAWAGARGQNLIHLQNIVSNPYLDNHLY